MGDVSTYRLIRSRFTVVGIFGKFCSLQDEPYFDTLEHAYPNQNSTFSPKVPPGPYQCKRGTHQLHDAKPFETFEITGVPGHTGILFHVGNYNSDSDGCVLLGSSANSESLNFSRQAFNTFMRMLYGVDEFTLVVS